MRSISGLTIRERPEDWAVLTLFGGQNRIELPRFHHFRDLNQTKEMTIRMEKRPGEEHNIENKSMENPEWKYGRTRLKHGRIVVNHFMSLQPSQ
ncbi:MAG: hypothetical protein ABSD70_13195 [Terracidiphilus sp.]